LKLEYDRLLSSVALNFNFRRYIKDEAAYAADVIGTGLPASPGAVVGQVVFCPVDAEVGRCRLSPC
jgi:hypothetical protein